MTRSFHNKILRVNLTEGTIEVEEPGPIYFRRYLGGWNIIADVLIKEVPKGTDPLGPDNRLIFAPGVLTGLAASGCSRNAVGAKSPLTGAFGASEVGGAWNAQFKRAGFDAVIFEGISPKPVYLWVHDGEVELRDASHLWGKETKETVEALQDELGDKQIGCTLIGPGGENLVRYACVMNETKDAAGRTGMGAVMGSKKLKAIVARGTQALGAVDAGKIGDMARTMSRSVQAGEAALGLHTRGTGGDLRGMVLTGNLPTRNFQDGDFEEGAWKISAENYLAEIGVGMEGCYACAVQCKKVVRAERVDPAYGGPEYESAASLGSCCGVDDAVAMCEANALCNANSLDTISTGVTIAFAMECFERGLLTIDDTDGIELRFGNGDAMVQMVEKIAHREGIGDLLAEGSKRAAEKIGGDAKFIAVEAKGQEYPMHEPRFKRGLAIGYAVSPTGADHCHALHDSGLVTPIEEGFMPDDTLRAMGIVEPMPLEDLGPDKARASAYHTIYRVLQNCLSICLFVPWTMDDYVDMVRAATGFDVTVFELLKAGERAFTLARVFNAREGFGIEDDHLAERSYGPTRTGALADGGIDREELRESLHSYYGMMGWDRDTGVPTADKLQELGVGWAADYLP